MVHQQCGRQPERYRQLLCLRRHHAPAGATVFGHSSSAATINKTALDPDETFLTDASTDGKPNAVVFIASLAEGYDKTLGVLYNTTDSKWTIVNQDGTAFVPSKDFNVIVFPGVIL